jgi:glycosidase
VEFAIRRIALIHNIIMTVGGIPLIYLGDEVATLNDYSYLDHPDHKHDSRWVHRPIADWDKYALRKDPTTIQGQMFEHLRQAITFRKKHPALSGGDLEIIHSGNPHVLSYTRSDADRRMVIFANFSETPELISAQVIQQNNLGQKKRLFGTSNISPKGELLLNPLEFVVFG